jgi:phospholipase/carboxylesterase
MPEMNHWRTDRPEEGYDIAQDTMLGLPVRTLLPESYEPGYAYPLMVLFHGRGGNEEQVLRLAPKISTQNFVYLSIRGPEPLGRRPSGQKGFGWQHPNADNMYGEYVRLAVELTRATYHIHSERVFLVGVNEGVEAAYRAGFALAGKVGGVVALNGTMPKPSDNRPLFRMQDARQMKLFLGQSTGTPSTDRHTMGRDYLALYAAGADVRYYQYPNSTKLTTSMFRDVNRWVVGNVNAEHDLYAIRD